MAIENFNLRQIKSTDIVNSNKWFNDQVSLLSKKRINPNQLISGSVGFRTTTNLTPGKPIFFYYDPKHKETLPYYDQFPLVIPFSKTPNGFIGLNLHYLGYAPRIKLFKELEKIFVKSSDELARIRLSWDLVKGVSRLRLASPCVKQYLFSHVKSPYCEIPRDYWYTAMLLPVQRFVGATKEQVWSNSNKNAGW